MIREPKRGEIKKRDRLGWVTFAPILALNKQQMPSPQAT